MEIRQLSFIQLLSTFSILMRFILCFKGDGAGDGDGIVLLVSTDNGWLSLKVGICVFGMTILADLTGIDFFFGL